MKRTCARGIAASCLTLAATLALAGCGGDDEPAAASPSSDTQQEATSTTTDDARRDGLAQGLEAAGATKVEMDDRTLRAHFDGSVEDPVAWTRCSALQIYPDEFDTYVLVYDDGELDCAERPGT